MTLEDSNTAENEIKQISYQNEVFKSSTVSIENSHLNDAG